MDFDQWKPLTGRGDPLRNDPTYDYEPPVLERVHYWAEDTRLEREHVPERKAEVLMLGVSSRRPSAAPRPPPRRHQRPHPPPKYEDYSYKINDRYPMTILVPPPPPPLGHKPSLYVLPDTKMPEPNTNIKITEPPTFMTKPPTTSSTLPEHLTSLYALQESNLIYQSSTTNQNWIKDLNQTKSIPNVVSSDYAGWGPTTPLHENDAINETQNYLIPTDHNELSKHPYTFYKPMLSEAPPPPQPTSSSIFLPTFIPTALPPTESSQTSFSQVTFGITKPTQSSIDSTTTEVPSSAQDYYDETTTEKHIAHQTKVTPSSFISPKPETSIFSMLGPMLSMPLVNGPERPEDNLYAHASENVQIFKEHSTEDSMKLETMQTMQPPPPSPVKNTESTTTAASYNTNPHFISNLIHKKPSKFTHDPYLHMRFTTTTPTTVEPHKNSKVTTDEPTIPFIIIQGHSKVKTYSSKPNFNDDSDTISNEIPKLNETNEVKHLHPIKEKKAERINTIRGSRSKNLKSLVDNSFGSIEIQETDIGIKYDVSDGSDVPIEIYRRGIVEGDDNTYAQSKKKLNEKRVKRQLDLEDLIPFDEDTIEEYVYNFLNGKRNSTGITGLIAQAVTSDAASVVDELEEDDDESEHEEDER